MILKSIILSSLVVGLSSCALVSPIFVDYNGVRRDVAQFINSKMSYSIADRRVLVAYAKGQQKILTADRLSPEAQQQLAYERAVGRYCASQHISLKKLNQVDAKIFSYPDQQANWQHIQNLQMQIQLNTNNIDCTGKF
ncbi:hypothetical protein [Acinetobacter towneri]|uniref:hypothetical protein n=1 Tax=Acinetobacter towneri TaxID=202956 RepID=UPI003A881299